MKHLPVLLLPLLLAAAPATLPVEAPGRTALTIHTPPPEQGAPYAIILDRRRVSLVEGENPIDFTDLPAELDASTFQLHSPNGKVRLREHTFIAAAAVAPDKVLKNFIGKQVLINRRQTTGNANEKPRPPETINATLLGFDERMLVLGTANRQLPVEILPFSADLLEIKLLDPGATLRPRPTVAAVLEARSSGEHDVQLVYRTRGLAWRCEYDVWLHPDDTATIAAAVTLDNRTGLDLRDAAIRLSLPADARTPAREYAIPRPVSVPSSTTRQVSILPRSVRVPARSMPVLLARPGNEPQRFDRYLVIEHKASALPPGRVRVAQVRPDAAPLPLDEFTSTGAAPEQPFLVRLGPADDLFARRIPGSVHLANGDGPRESRQPIQVVVQNRSAVATQVMVIERLPSSALDVDEASAPYARTPDSTLQFTLDVPPKSEKKLSFVLVRAGPE